MKRLTREEREVIYEKISHELDEIYNQRVDDYKKNYKETKEFKKVKKILEEMKKLETELSNYWNSRKGYYHRDLVHILGTSDKGMNVEELLNDFKNYEMDKAIPNSYDRYKYSEINNDLVLMGLGKDFDVDKVIKDLVDKYSK